MLGPDATVPPEFLISTFIDVPDYVGTDPTPFDGIWEGYFIVDFKKCLPLLQTYTMLTLKISKGIIREIEAWGEISNVDGFVNKRGIYIARAGIGHLTFAGKISGDRLSGKWDSWGSVLCAGQVELIRSTGDQHYCVDRLGGHPYSSASECQSIDKLLTKAEFESWQPSLKRK